MAQLEVKRKGPFWSSTMPNGGVSLSDNPRHPLVVDDTQLTPMKPKTEKLPDIYR